MHITASELKPNMIVRRVFGPETMPERCWAVLQVTQEDIDSGYLTDQPGLYGFGGMWYGERTGDNPADHRSYGKMISFTAEDTLELVNPDLDELPVDWVKSITE